MAAARFIERLNEQIAYEFSASQQYVANAVYYDAQTLPRLAAFFYAQAVEERNHAMMMVRYLLDSDAQVTIPAVTAPETEFDDVVAPVALALDQERRVSDQVAALTEVARDEGDYLSEQFVQWFLKEQVEEVASMSSLLAVVQRSSDNPMQIEDYLVREHSSEGGADPTAPPAAGGACHVPTPVRVIVTGTSSSAGEGKGHHRVRSGVSGNSGPDTTYPGDDNVARDGPGAAPTGGRHWTG